MRFRHLERYRIRQFCELGLQTSHMRSIIFSPYGVLFPERIRNIKINFQISPNCHFDSLNLVRNSNLEFEFMHKMFGQLEERNSSVLDLSLILGFYQLVLGRNQQSSLDTIHWPCRHWGLRAGDLDLAVENFI